MRLIDGPRNGSLVLLGSLETQAYFLSSNMWVSIEERERKREREREGNPIA